MAAAGVASAQFGYAPSAKIDKVRIGFRPAGESDRDSGARAPDVYKIGLWAPVSVGVEFLKGNKLKKGIALEVSTTDGDDLRTVSVYPIIPAIAADPDSAEFQQDRGPGARKEPFELTNTAYVRLPGEFAEVRLRLVQEDDPERGVSDTVVIGGGDLRPRSSSKYVILTLGGKLPGVAFANPKQYEQRVEFAHLDRVQEMPDQWFGYEAADLIVLPTGGPKPEFIAELFNSADPTFARKRRALFEWVRRGGKLVMSVGDRAAEVAASPDFAGYIDTAADRTWVPGLLPVQVTPLPRRTELRLDKPKNSNASLAAFTVEYPKRRYSDFQRAVVRRAVGPVIEAQLPEFALPTPFAVAGLKDNQRKTPFATLLTAGTDRMVVQVPFGLGRVTVVGFDIDRSPFTDAALADYRGAFWEWLLGEAGDRELARSSNAQGGPADDGFNLQPGRGGRTPARSTTTTLSREGEDGIVAALRGSVDHYDEVPVISFGWVALFILGYTLIIGPIEYILLKKLIGRLELTWITFPLIVLTVSGAAYLTAYAVKGKDLRMNKIDVVDVDLRTDPARPRVYGRTWFTVFSPRIDSYTIGVEPKENWAKSRDEKGFSPVTTVDWFSLPSRAGNPSSRGYKYDIDPRGDTSPRSNGLAEVPIQVWSTKAFTANWSGVADPTAPPVTADLRRLENGALAGEVRYNIALKDVEQALLAYRGKVYPFEKAVLPGVPVSLTAVDWDKGASEGVFQNDSKFTAIERDDDQFGGFGGRRTTSKEAAPATNAQPLNLWGLLFHRLATTGGGYQNGTLRPLDQSWRLSPANTDEVILLFKLKRASKQPAEQLMTDPDSPSPTRVWLHGLPGGKEKWAVDGIAQQDTYVRVYLPVKPAGR